MEAQMKNRPVLPILARPMLVLGAALALSGCISFGAKPPAQLLTLSSDQKVAPGPAQSVAMGSALTVLDPDTPKKLDTVRMPVQVDDTSIAYVTNGQWVDTPRRLFQKLLSETIAATTGRLVLDPGQFTADPGVRLMGTLVDFGVDARTGSAVVTYDAALISADSAKISKRRFTASAPIGGAIEPIGVSRAINVAANKVAADVAVWVGK
jgi:cholesterol transport system auxiliary component